MATVTVLEKAFNEVVERVGVTMPRIWYTSVDSLCKENNIDRDFLDWDYFTEDWQTRYSETEAENGFVEFHVYSAIYVLISFDDDSINEIVRRIQNYLDSRITCSVCGKTFDEEAVNIVDYADDVCIDCEGACKEQIADVER